MFKKFDPKEDITAYELAVIFANIAADPNNGPINRQEVWFSSERWDELPAAIKRHWR